MKLPAIKILPAFILLSFFATSCNNNSQNQENNNPKKEIKQPILGTWALTDFTSNETAGANEDKLLKAARDKRQVKAGRKISVFADNTFTEINGSGEYQEGKWKAGNNNEMFEFVIGPNTTIFLPKN